MIRRISSAAPGGAAGRWLARVRAGRLAAGPEAPGRPADGGARRWAIDAAIAVLVTGAELGLTAGSSGWHQGVRPAAPGTAGYLLIVLSGLALVARRRYPVTVLGVTLGACLAAEALGVTAPWFALILAFFTAVLARRRLAAIASLVIGYLGAVWPPWLIGAPGYSSLVSALALLVGLIVLLSAAELIRARRQRMLALERTREERALRRAGEERLRIARDLHDVVSHNISVINVQAGTALHLMDRQPERAREALTTIHQVSKQALVELRTVLGVLRESDEEAPRSPSPGISRLDELAANAQSAGISVRLEKQDCEPVPADVDVAAYRIVQEALTNTARHSGGTAVTVQVSRSDGTLVVQVDDDGPGAAAREPGAGSGIAGMTERAHALGGTLDAGPRPGGGFRVLARLPLAGGSS
jgi:signal transduction histidine kinase